MRFFAAGTLALLLACGAPPAVVADVDATLESRALVVVGTSEQEEAWTAFFDIANAPADEYFLFESGVAPTSLAGLSSFDPASCAGSCTVAGLGEYMNRVTLSAPGRVQLKGSWDGATDGSTRYFTIVRRSAEPAAALRVTGGVGIGGSGCVIERDPADVSYARID